MEATLHVLRKRLPSPRSSNGFYKSNRSLLRFHLVLKRPHALRSPKSMNILGNPWVSVTHQWKSSQLGSSRGSYGGTSRFLGRFQVLEHVTLGLIDILWKLRNITKRHENPTSQDRVRLSILATGRLSFSKSFRKALQKSHSQTIECWRGRRQRW